MTHFDIQVVSDTVCPWCYVGKTRLDKAIATYRSAHPSSADTFSTSWHPFYLNPSAPTTGVSKGAYYEQKFGAARTAAIFERLAAVGRAEGIAFKFGGKTGNTRASHRLMELAKRKSAEAETRLVEELFAAYFESERDITDHDVLVAAAVRAGIEEGEARGWVDGDEGGEKVDEEARRAARRMISGVPHFTIQGKYELGGAQEPEAFLEIFEKVKAKDHA
ncbi:MAG: hypothetical protein M1833_005254 [Piccolia ochrophora]|nr:MAG: hypothetical protein M1833_005254 [Piccolia ochrophora]